MPENEIEKRECTASCCTVPFYNSGISVKFSVKIKKRRWNWKGPVKGAFSKSTFEEGELVLIAMPSYGGRVPKLAAERLSQIQGNSADCVLLCVYGNRAYEESEK